MLEPLREAVKRGAQVVCINPLKERGLERFQHPQHPLEMLTNGDKPTNTAYFRPALGGDMAILRGMAKFLLLWERQAQAEGKAAVFDHDFLNEHTTHVLDYLGQIDDTSPGKKSSRSPACLWWKSSKRRACTPKART
jgi:anaerobic selenocysteine-containing dehydrogenase